MLKRRIGILRNAGVISPEIADFVDRVIDLLAERFPQTEKERLEMFTTHLAMAAERIRKGETVSDLGEEIWDDIQGNEHFSQAEDFYGRDDDVLPGGIFRRGETFYAASHLQHVKRMRPGHAA